MPTDPTTIATWIAAFVFVLALIVVGAWLVKSVSGGGNGNKSGGFLRGRERRIGVVQAANLDGRRRLVLLRRDDVEHLIMTGGPVDVVIETGIHRPRPAQRSHPPERDDDRVIIARDEHQPPPGRHEQE